MRDTHVRLPDELYEWLKKEADADHRSINGQIVWLLQQAASREGVKSWKPSATSQLLS